MIEGLHLPDDEAQRLLGKHKATRYLKGMGQRSRTARVVLEPESEPCWMVEERGGKTARAARGKESG